LGASSRRDERRFIAGDNGGWWTTGSSSIIGEACAVGVTVASETEVVESASTVLRVRFESEDLVLSMDDIGTPPPIIPSPLSISSNSGNSTLGNSPEGANSLDIITGIGAMVSTSGSIEGISAEVAETTRLVVVQRIVGYSSYTSLHWSGGHG
jgi:hypothetical protein